MQRYTIFLGLNDKDEKKQIIATSDAKNMVTEMVVKSFGFGTIYDATGVYKHDDGTGAVVVENTLGVIVLGAKMAEMVDFVANLKRAFNQETVSVTVEDVDSQLW